ncbi:helix-turn-helix domain-containing protein [Arthrobacter pigmenti]
MTIAPMNPNAASADVSQAVGGEVRAWMARRQFKQRDLSELLDVPQSSVSARLNGRIAFTINELATIASWFEITLGELLGSDVVDVKKPRTRVEHGAGSLPQLDSNQQPFD